MIEGGEVVGWKQRSIACWALVVVLWAGTAAAEDSRLLKAGDVFPDFSLERSDGSIWRMSDYSEHPKIIMFWATWCPYCRKLFPGIVALNRQYSDEGLEIVAINFRDDGDTDAYARKHGLNFDIVLSGDTLAADVGVRGTPTVFVLDRNNRIQLRSSNSNPEDPILAQAVAAVTGSAQ